MAWNTFTAADLAAYEAFNEKLAAQRDERKSKKAEILDECREHAARMTRLKALKKRAEKIVERIMPAHRTPHGFYDPIGFVENSIRNSERRRLWARVYERLQKKEGL